MHIFKEGVDNISVCQKLGFIFRFLLQFHTKLITESRRNSPVLNLLGKESQAVGLSLAINSSKDGEIIKYSTVSKSLNRKLNN